MAQIPVTQAGKEKLKKDLEAMKKRVPIIRQAIQEARDKGDLKENAEYHSAREELSMLQGTMAELSNRFNNAVVIDTSNIDTDTIAFGARFELDDGDDIEEWFLVGDGEDDPLENKILTSSPMGQALLGHKIGDEIKVEAPMGILTYIVKSITY